MEDFQWAGGIHRVHSAGLHCGMARVSGDAWGMMAGQGMMESEPQDRARAYDRSLDAHSVGTGAAELRDNLAKDSCLPRCSLFVNCSHRSLMMSAIQAVKSHLHSLYCFLFDLFYCCPRLV